MKESQASSLSSGARRRWFPLDLQWRSSDSAVASFSIIAFLAITLLVHYRFLAASDRSVAEAAHSLSAKSLDTLGALLSILFSAELSVVYALLLGLFLWRRGFGLWSLAPFAFLPLVLLEIVMKATIHQPMVPPELQRASFYPLATVHMEGSFPSGHAIRGAFLSIFLMLLLTNRGRAFTVLAVFCAVAVVVLLAFTRLYLGQHWLSDVIAGSILGGAAAWVTADPIARRLRT